MEQTKNVKHGLYKTKLYKEWLRIKRACNMPSQSSYKYIGGKGIKLYEGWTKDFVSFSNRSITSPSLYPCVFTHSAKLTKSLFNPSYILIPLTPMYLYEDCEGILQALLIRNHSLYNFVL